MNKLEPNRKTIVSHWTGGCLAMLLASLLPLSPGQAQTPSPPETEVEKIEPIEPQTDEFRRAADELREHLKLMREVLVRFNVSTDRAEDRGHRDEWNTLRQRGVVLHQAMVSAALDEYLRDPQGRIDLADMLFRLLKRYVELDRYEGMLEVAQALWDNQYSEAELRSLLAMSALASNQYDVLQPHMTAMFESGEVSPALAALEESLPALEQAWEDELAARAADAAGDPLPRVLIRTTKGDMEVELYENQAPETVGNFIHLVESGFYEGLTFHRVIEHFMAQTGCPVGDGSGGPGYTVYGEMNAPGARDFFRGTLGLALAQAPNSGGSQFFIMYMPNHRLNGNYTAFGRVISGIEVLSNLARVNPDDKEKSETPPVLDEVIAIEVLYKRDHAYQPNKVQAAE